MNKDSIIHLCHKVSRETGLNFNIALIYFFLESILLRLAQSQFKDSFVLKGGFLLSNLIGVEERTTLDMDFLLHNLTLSQDKIIEIFEEILREDNQDPVNYEILDIKTIKKSSPYAGYRLNIQCSLENVRQIIPLDIATGDLITPGSIDYHYHSLFNNGEIPIRAYPVETILSEKIQTIFDKGFLNSRSKDFYDLYILSHLWANKINYAILLEACKRTFRNRNSEWDIEKLKALVNTLKLDSHFEKRWLLYATKNTFAKDVLFASVIEGVMTLFDKLALYELQGLKTSAE